MLLKTTNLINQYENMQTDKVNKAKLYTENKIDNIPDFLLCTTRPDSIIYCKDITHNTAILISLLNSNKLTAGKLS